MNRKPFRQAFIAHVGRNVFRRFAIQLRADAERDSSGLGRTVNRLRFWQSKIWDEVLSQMPDTIVPTGIDSIRESLLWCDIHECHLENGQAVPDRIGITDRDGAWLDPNFEKSLFEQFPFGFGFWTLICPKCVAACESWMLIAESTSSRRIGKPPNN